MMIKVFIIQSSKYGSLLIRIQCMEFPLI